MADNRTRKRKANGEGTIYLRKDGRWEGAAYVLTSDNTYKRVRRYGRTREEVHGKLVQLLERSRRGVPLPSRPWKLREFMEYWLENVVRPSRSWNTYKKYEQTARLYLNPGIGKQPLQRLRVATVQTFLNGRLRAGDSIAKVHIMRTVLSACLTRAMREELISLNVARLATLPPAKPRRNRPWSAEEARRFLDYARRDPLYPAFILLLVYGLRRGEVLGLGWEDIDLDESVLRVGWQLQRLDGELMRVKVKTDAGHRTLPLLSIAEDALLELAVWQASARRVAGDGWVETGYVFVTRTGRPIEPRNLARSFERLAKGAGLRVIRLHDLRHTVASLLKKLRTAPNDAKEILGHARISTTMEIYTHGDEEDQRSALGKISDELFGEQGE
jgi:integrase